MPEEEVVSIPEHLKEGSGRRVLLVEPDETFRNEVWRRLYEAGYEVHAAADAAAALAILTKPDAPRLHAVITEITLPDSDDFAFFQELRAHPHAAGVPVMVLTEERTADAPARAPSPERANQTNREKAYHLGVGDCLTRDCDPMEMVARLNAAVRMREAALARLEPLGSPCEGWDVTANGAATTFRDFARALHFDAKDGLLRVKAEGVAGEVYFERGAIRHATATAESEFSGVDALYALNLAGVPAFDFRDGDATEERTVTEKTERVLGRLDHDASAYEVYCRAAAQVESCSDAKANLLVLGECMQVAAGTRFEGNVADIMDVEMVKAGLSPLKTTEAEGETP